MKALLPTLLLLVLLAACTPYGPVTPANDSGATPEKIENVAQGVNAFSIDLYKEVKDLKENLFFSPYSISTALAMTYEGARGETATEMAETMHFPAENETRRAGYASLYNRLQGKQDGFEIQTANALFIKEGYPILPRYLSLINAYYRGEATTLDATDPVGQVNGWVEEQTKSRIKEIIKKIPSSTRMVLTNAIYFKGDWVWEFDEKETLEQPFSLADGDHVMTDLMQQTNKKSRYGYTEDDDVQVLQLPYKGDRLSMLVILPKEIDGLAAVEESLSTEKLQTWRGTLHEEHLKVYLPTFEFSDAYSLGETLAKMGMPTAFTPNANFSGMTGDNAMTRSDNLHIGVVLHKAFIKVDEKGTEAAAATVVTMVGTTSIDLTPKPLIFRADHPFLFLIQDDETGTILFMGRITDPSTL